jgi:23S rRNA pseudouridine1911/1915/1917 synthase
MHIKSEKTNVRIDQYLAEELDLSRSKIQKLIKDEKINVNGNIISNNYKVKMDDEIDIIDELDFEINITAENIPLNIVYEDQYLMIINKESGMVVHPAPGNYSGTLVNALMGKFNLSNDKIRPGIVHRIDKDTSGLLVVAKDDKTHELLGDMIKNKDVERIYVALVDGVIKHETGTIDAPIGRDPNNRQKMKVTDENSKDAKTHFRVLKRFTNQTLIECKLETGRTHQIRVHMQYIGFPICNDPVYGRGKKTTSFGQLLHSKSIRFVHPITKKEIYFESDIPDEFKEYLKSIEN